jgi:V/A-type H+-transporting ATPase subunit F
VSKSGKIAVIGNKDAVLAFKAVGAAVFDADTASAANDILRRLVKEDYAVIFVTERIAETIADTLAILKSRPYPIVIPIPDGSGTNGFGVQSMKKDVEKAVGADIIFNH